LSKQLGYSTTTQKYPLTGEKYGIYNDDWYFLNVNRADVPDLKNNAVSLSDENQITGFKVKSQFTKSGITTYDFKITSSESIGVVS